MDAKDDLKRTTLRLPQYLYARVEAIAEENGRSFNAEIVKTLEGAYPPDPFEAIDTIEKELLRLDDLPEREDYRKILLHSLKYYRKEASEK